MAKIHNNSKQNGPRMPLILSEETEQLWLNRAEEQDNFELTQLFKELPSDLLNAHTVSPLRGKLYKGNVPEISEELIYPELAFFDFTI